MRPNCQIHVSHASNDHHHGPTPPGKLLVPPHSNSFNSTTPYLTIANNPHRPQNSRPPRILSPSEQRDRRAEGLCFNCDDAYGPNHTCRKPVLAILECPTPISTGDNIEFHDCPPAFEDSATDIDPLHRLHAITNTTVGEMMRFQGSINDMPINIFIDCGAAMNFLNPTIAHRLGLPITSTMNFKFSTASGQAISPSGEAHGVTVKIQDYQLTASFLLLAVTGCDLVLGAQWLDTLGFYRMAFLGKSHGLLRPWPMSYL